MKKLRCLVVDDEILAQDLLEAHISKIPELELVGKSQTALEARSVLAEVEVDVLFLDIEMPELSGLDFLKTLDNPPLTILTTAYSEFALEGYELNVIDYLLKPITFQRFFKAASKVLNLRKENNEEIQEVKLEQDCLFVKADYKIVRINFEDILFIEGMQKYVKFQLKDKAIATLLTLSKLDKLLPEKRFFRVQKSFIVNLSKIDSLTGNLVCIGEHQISMGKNVKSGLIARLDQFGLLD